MLLHGCFSRFLNCTNVTKSRKASEDYADQFENAIHKIYWSFVLLYRKHYRSNDTPSRLTDDW